jgi:chitodextrinase
VDVLLNGRTNSKLSLDAWTRHVIDSQKPWQAVFISAADLDRDGLLDIVTGGWWYKNPGSPSGVWTRNTIGTPLNNMAALYDFDGDGDFDVLGTQGQGSATDARFVWAQNNGAGSFTIRANISSGQGDFLQGVAVARFANGGPLEVALSWHVGGQGVQMLTVPTNPVVSTWPWRVVSTQSQDEQLTAGDIDRNGDLDLLLGTQWMRNGGGTWNLQTLNPSAGLPDRNRLVDVNGDGRLDAVVGFEGVSTTAKLVWYEQPVSPTGTWTEHLIANLIGPMSVDVADLDHDGDVDVVVGEHNLANPASARLIIFENLDGVGGSWQPHVVYTGDEHHDGAQLVDIDGDGDLDIISIGWGHSQVLLYENLAVQGSVSQVATPTITPNGGSFSGSVTVALKTATAGATIRYTLDGTVPGAGSPLYTASFPLTNGVTVQARAFQSGLSDSAVASATFTPAADTTPPTAPGNLTGIGTSTNTVQLAWQASSDNVGVTEYRISRNGALVATLPATPTSYQDTGLTATTTYAYSIVARDAASNTSTPATVSVTTPSGGGSTAVARVNAGGGAFVDAAGNTWSADFGFNTGATYSNPSAISGTVNDGLYQSERYDVSSSPELTYSFNLPNGDYTVNLHFAEIYSGAARVGGRVFDVLVEGQLRIDNLDIFSRVGDNTALIISLPVTISDGQLNIAFVHGVDNPKISAIEVLGAQASVDTTRPTITSVTAVNGNSVQVLFSKPVTTTSSQAVGNYSINNGVTNSVAVLGADTRTVTLTTSTLASGSYMLTVNNVTDQASPANTIVANSQIAFGFTSGAKTYEQWCQVYFTSAELSNPIVSGETCDPDGDGISNLMEYALGLNPRVANNQGRPAARIENGVLVLTCTRNKEAADVVLDAEAATLLAGPWSAGLIQQVISDDGVIQTIKVIDSVAVGAAESRFLRLTLQFR